MSKQFEVGKTYSERFMSDYDSIASFTILARTAKTITTEVHGKRVVRRVRVASYDDTERFNPFGSYSMAMVVSAKDTDAPAVETSRVVSWKPEVQTDSTGQWYGNALRFTTKEEAEGNVKALMWNWTAVRETRVVESEDPPNYCWVNGNLLPYSKLGQALLLDKQKGSVT